MYCCLYDFTKRKRTDTLRNAKKNGPQCDLLKTRFANCLKNIFELCATHETKAKHIQC